MSNAATQPQEAPNRAPQTAQDLAIVFVRSARDPETNALAQQIMAAINAAQVSPPEVLIALAQAAAPVLGDAPDPALAGAAFVFILKAATREAARQRQLAHTQAAGHG